MTIPNDNPKTAIREAHEEMGFHQDWSQCTDQLAALVASL